MAKAEGAQPTMDFEETPSVVARDPLEPIVSPCVRRQVGVVKTRRGFLKRRKKDWLPLIHDHEDDFCAMVTEQILRSMKIDADRSYLLYLDIDTFYSLTRRDVRMMMRAVQHGPVRRQLRRLRADVRHLESQVGQAIRIYVKALDILAVAKEASRQAPETIFASTANLRNLQNQARKIESRKAIAVRRMMRHATYKIEVVVNDFGYIIEYLHHKVRSGDVSRVVCKMFGLNFADEIDPHDYEAARETPRPPKRAAAR